MSGSLGTWPISPAAKPREAGAVGGEGIEMGGRDQLRARPRVHVHELREVELDAQRPPDRARISSTVGAAIVAIRASSSSVSASVLTGTVMLDRAKTEPGKAQVT